MITVELLIIDKRVLIAATLTSFILGNFEQVPISSDQELFSLFKPCTSQSNIRLSKNKVGGQQLYRVLVEDLLVDQVVHSVIDMSVGPFKLVIDDHSFGLINSSQDFFFLKVSFGW